MLLYLFDALADSFSVFNVFRYLTFRSICGVLTALTICFVVGPRMIRKLSHYQIGQTVRSDGPPTHFDKVGTPTMGGMLILVSVVLSTLLWAELSNRFIWILLFATVSFGVIGWIDDYRKLVTKNPRGMGAGAKFFWQSAAGLVCAVFLFLTAETEIETALIVPIFKTVSLQLGIWFIPLAWFIVVGFSNAVNLTDGLDGLAIMPTVLVTGALGIFSYLTGHSIFSSYLGIPYVSGVGEVLVFCAALVGAGLGFLWFNTYPASGIHGRYRGFVARGRRRPDCRYRPAGNRSPGHGWCLRNGNRFGDPAGEFVQVDRQAGFSHGAAPSPL